MSTILYRHRNSKMPPLPDSVESMIVPPMFQNTEHQKLFLIMDEMVNDDRIVGFCSKLCLDVLFDSSDIFMDGTFSVVPKPFVQLVTVHGIKSDQAIPCAFFLASSKRQLVYSSILTNLKQAAVRKNKEFAPKYIHCDFELALIKAVKVSMPKSRLCGCYFHYAQAIYRKFAQKKLGNETYKDGPISKSYAFMRTMPLLPRDLIKVIHFDQFLYLDADFKPNLKGIKLQGYHATLIFSVHMNVCVVEI